jgi:hypothetical protein
MTHNKIDLFNESVSAYGFFMRSIKNLSSCRRREFNKVLNNDYVFLFNGKGDIHVCGLDLNGLKDAINRLSMRPYMNDEYVQSVLNNGLVFLIDGPMKKPEMKFFCTSYLIKRLL